MGPHLCQGAPFAMECAARTEADKKGGHLAKDVKHGDEIRTRAATATPRPSAVAATSTARNRLAHRDFESRRCSSGGLLLRESAQCPEADEGAFQDVSRYRYFNTNNLWVDLEALASTMDAHNGVQR